MSKSKTMTLILAFGIVMLMLLSAGAFAQGGLGGITINGFGHQNYIKTDTNTYVVPDGTDGSFEDYVMGLTFTAKPSDQVFVRAQIVHQNNEVRVDWGFGEYRFNEYLAFKAGKVKLPFGLYTETMDVKAMQPFSYLPGIYFYGVNSYNGVGLLGSYEAESGWGGEAEIFRGQSVTSDGVGRLKDLVGTQIWVTPPVMGAKAGFGYWQTEINVPGWPVMDVSIAMISAEYVGDQILVRAEHNFTNANSEEVSTNTYVEAGYLIKELVQPVVRWANTKLENPEAELQARGLTADETDIAFGVNIFPAEGFVFKAEHHIVDGNASLEPTQRQGQNLAPDDKWGLTAISVAFMF
ncbi:MAG: hypothetical protein GY867_07750 [bacterium]|nr:hypothetical protein [bacterium]